MPPSVFDRYPREGDPPVEADQAPPPPPTTPDNLRPWLLLYSHPLGGEKEQAEGVRRLADLQDQVQASDGSPIRPEGGWDPRLPQRVVGSAALARRVVPALGILGDRILDPSDVLLVRQAATALFRPIILPDYSEGSPSNLWITDWQMGFYGDARRLGLPMYVWPVGSLVLLPVLECFTERPYTHDCPFTARVHPR